MSMPRANSVRLPRQVHTIADVTTAIVNVSGEFAEHAPTSPDMNTAG